jgi:hypothetical protein
MDSGVHCFIDIDMIVLLCTFQMEPKLPVTVTSNVFVNGVSANFYRS